MVKQPSVKAGDPSWPAQRGSVPPQRSLSLTKGLAAQKRQGDVCSCGQHGGSVLTLGSTEHRQHIEVSGTGVRMGSYGHTLPVAL